MMYRVLSPFSAVTHGHFITLGQETLLTIQDGEDQTGLANGSHQGRSILVFMGDVLNNCVPLKTPAWKAETGRNLRKTTANGTVKAFREAG